MNNTIKYIAIISILFAMIGTVAADSYYVSNNGNDKNSGTSMNNAFETINHGSSQLSAGDILYINGGTYWNDAIRFENSGTSNNYIKVTNYNNEKVKMYHSEEFNDDTMMRFVDVSYIKVENIETSHYGSCCYIAGKYKGNTHHIIIDNVDSLRSYSRGYACNSGAHDISFSNILIKDVNHPTSSPNGFDFLTSPHDKNYNKYSDYMIYNIDLYNVDIDYVESHNGFNFGQGLTPNDGDYTTHWEGKLCNNFHFNGCDVAGAAGAGYYTNKYVLRNSVIENCDVNNCYNGLGLIGDNLLIENLVSHDNDMNGMFFLWDTEQNDITIKCYTGYNNAKDLGLANGPEFTIIKCGEKAAKPDESNWILEYTGKDSKGGTEVITSELQDATHHWLNDIPVRDHVLTTEDLQYVTALWLEGPDEWMVEYIGENSDGGTEVTKEEIHNVIYHYLMEETVRGHIITKEDAHMLMHIWGNV